MVQKPDFNQLKLDEQLFTQTAGTLQSVLNNEKIQEESISRAIHLLKKMKAVHSLSSVPTSELASAKAGIRISSLTDAGLENLAQIYSSSDRALQKIPGIGEKQVETIRKILDSFQENYAKNAVVSIDPDEHGPETVALLQALDRYIATQKVYRTLKPSGREFMDFIVPTLSDIQVRSKLGWFFAGRDKKERTRSAYLAMEGYRLGNTMHTVLSGLSDFQTAIERTLATAEENFRTHSADFYALLDKFGENKVNHNVIYNSVPEQLANEIDAEELDTSSLNATLREYQVFGAKYVLHQKKVLLGDEMGLGKTIQALAVMCHLQAKFQDASVDTEHISAQNTHRTALADSAAQASHPHFLVVCPASVLVNWCREIRTKSDIPAHLVHGQSMESALETWQENGGAAVTNYESMKRIVDRIDNHMKLELLVIDEAHYIKNPNAQRTKLLRRITDESARILMMTGTPLENRVEEMCTLMDFVQPETAAQVRKLALAGSSQAFRTMAAPVYLRRLRSDVLKELPPITEENQWLEPTAADFEAYRQQVGAKNFMQMRRVSFLGNNSSRNSVVSSSVSSASASAALAFAAPASAAPAFDAPAFNSPDSAAPAFDTLAFDAPDSAAPASSAKLTRLLELVEQAKEGGRKVVVFSYFRETIDIVEHALGSHCSGVITGSTEAAQRQQIVDLFSESTSANVLVCQITAGGTGLNIQAASIVIFCEPQIKPSLEMQAISRVYRMGQVNHVAVYHLLCENTVDEAIQGILAEKKAVFDEYADESAMAQAADNLISNAWIAEYVEKEHERLLPAVISSPMEE